MMGDGVFLLGWDNSPNTAERLINIVVVSGNQVKVQMHEGVCPARIPQLTPLLKASGLNFSTRTFLACRSKANIASSSSFLDSTKSE
jgi:hypothetical protein